MEAIDLMYYTITAALIVFTLGVVIVVYQISLLFWAIKRFIIYIESLPAIAKLASGSIQAALLTFVLKLFKRNRGGA